MTALAAVAHGHVVGRFGAAAVVTADAGLAGDRAVNESPGRARAREQARIGSGRRRGAGCVGSRSDARRYRGGGVAPGHARGRLARGGHLSRAQEGALVARGVAAGTAAVLAGVMIGTGPGPQSRA